jgi:hypothetical protein
MEGQSEETRQRVTAEIDEAMSKLDALLKSRWWNSQKQLAALMKARDEMYSVLWHALTSEPAPQRCEDSSGGVRDAAR